ncbi:uncharacterized protein [Salminus brasiliensis]|uniref:uncharacterized protein isoform X2 n=1 Tax=Salminus brasiliensis TaxID=930266 RepID=UPI003B82F044
MPAECSVPGCEKYEVARAKGVIFHRFPEKDVELCRKWLAAIGRDVNTPRKNYVYLRVCSQHFTPEDYERDLKAELLGYPPRLMLKKPAIPSLFIKKRKTDPSENQILEPIDFSTKDEPSEDPAYEEMEVILSSDDFLSEYESPEEEEKKKKTKKTKRNSSSDEWEPPAQGTAKDSENSEMSVEEEEDEESDGSNGLADDGSMPVVGCEECGSEARLQCSLLRHEKVFACPKCVSGDGADTRCLEKLLVRFADYNNFQIHAEQEHGVTTKRVLCQECGVFYMKPTEANGKKEHVCEYKTKHFVCSNCDKRFRTEKGLKAHTQKLHGNMVHPCKYCLTPFRNRPAKLEHEENHPKEEKPYLCPDCPEKFRNIVKRNRHLRSHRGPWKYICKTCGKGFPHLDRLERHELIHSGEKPFRCEVCDRSFSQDGHLKSHMRLHTGEKPYKCTFCEKCFNHNVSLKSHVLRYHSSEAAPPVEGALENSVPKTKKKKLHPLRPRGRPKRVLGNEEQENGESRELS